jgi:hypothetical protein
MAGSKLTLEWSAINADSCTASGGWSGLKAAKGLLIAGPVVSGTTYTLSCVGPGGSGSASAAVSIVAATAVFPLRTEAGKRYLVDASGKPFFIHGDAAWSLISRASDADADRYLALRSAQGFNAVLVELMEHQYSPFVPRDARGFGPLFTPGDYATPDEHYFAHAEWVIRDALRKGMLVILTASYMGYGGGDEGWYREMSANGAAKMHAFGRYLANRFAAYPNIMWVEGGDYNPPDRALLDAIPDGIRTFNQTWLHTFHGRRGTSALGFLGTNATWLGCNDVYTDETDVVAKSYIEYNRSAMPFFLIEDRYEGDKHATALTLRSQAYQAVLSGASGHIMGNSEVWPFGAGWQAAVKNSDAPAMGNLRQLLESHRWWILQPDTEATLLTGGALEGASRAAAAIASDRSVALIYIPSSRSLTVALSRLAGPRIDARWYNPASGAYSGASDSAFGAAGTQSFTPAAAGDWVLVLESVP